ncbi:hypothetical protein [Bacillus sp. FJAT-27251]|uniref:hypothetical protein n=1 Tax=Bacillus sp. FJAT-27251 TaxID=1684142 RepID=UPI0006A78FCE|nr:hypothetical protein [Bacillus sp. FJAT-27251]
MFFLPTNVNIAGMKLNNIDHGSSVSFSSTLKKNRNVKAKKNQGWGQQLGDGCLKIGIAGSTLDHDVEDSNAEKNTVRPL